MGRWTAAVLAATLLCGTHATSAATDSAAVTLKQFTSRGHVLGFDDSGYYVSNGTYALRVQFEGAQAVAPASEDSGSDAPEGKAAPLSRVSYKECC